LLELTEHMGFKTIWVAKILSTCAKSLANKATERIVKNNMLNYVKQKQ